MGDSVIGTLLFNLKTSELRSVIRLKISECPVSALIVCLVQPFNPLMIDCSAIPTEFEPCYLTAIIRMLFKNVFHFLNNNSIVLLFFCISYSASGKAKDSAYFPFCKPGMLFYIFYYFLQRSAVSVPPSYFRTET